MKKQCTIEITTFPQGSKRQDMGWLSFVPDDGTENEVINIYPEVQYQEFEGFGGAFTDSAGYVYSLMKEEQQKHLLGAYFGEDGLGYTIGRVHLDSCDFSLEHYEAIQDSNDRELKTFTLERSEKYILPLVRDAQKVFGKNIPMMAAPWSPPAFMKSNKGRNGGGVLLEEYKDFYADYLCHYIKEMRKAGADIVRMTSQNEPKAVQTWDSCIYTALQEKEFILNNLYPALQRHGLEDIEIFLWDHNKERVYERVSEILDSDTDSLIGGVAFHWYSGDHFEALDLIRQQFPGKKMVQSEACIEYSKCKPEDFLLNAQKYAHDIIGDLNGGMTAFYDWNLVLDGQGGPNHVGNYCDAPFLYHVETGVLEERASYSYIRHFSKNILPGAKRIGFSRYSDKLDVTAFENPNKEISTIILNRSKELMPVTLRVQGLMTRFFVPGESIATVKF